MTGRLSARIRVTGLLLVAAALVLAAATAGAHDGIVTDDPNHQETEIQGHFTDEFLAQADAAFAQGQGGAHRPPRSRNVSVVGQLSFGET